MPAAPALVLLVEDDPELRQLVCSLLEDEGLHVHTVSDGQQAIDWFQRQRPALVLLDIGLPVVDGYGVAAALQAHYAGGVPLVVMTANGQAQKAAAAMGAQAYVSKPFDIDVLASTVHDVLAAA